jgi:N-acetylneuraminic acid mutarotase
MRLRFTLISMALVIQVQAVEWERMAPLPEPASGFVAGAVKGKILVAGGTNWPGGVKHWMDSVWLFDPATNQWQAGPRLPHGVGYAACGSDGAKLYFAGGGDGPRAHREVYSLDEDMKLTHVGDLPGPLMYTSGALHNGVLHILGGAAEPEDWTHSHARHFAFVVADGKTGMLDPLEAFEHGVRIPAMAGAGGRLFAFTGTWFDEAVAVHNAADAFVYDKEWRRIRSYPWVARGVAAVTLDDGDIYLAGGYGSDDEGFLSKAWIYEVAKNRYLPALPLPIAASTCLVKCGAHVYYLGGEDVKKHRTDACFRVSIQDLTKSIQK